MYTSCLNIMVKMAPASRQTKAFKAAQKVYASPFRVPSAVRVVRRGVVVRSL